LLGLPFIAVMAASTAKSKIEKITFYGGQCHFVEHPCQLYVESERLARELNGHFMDQFTYAECATDWCGNNNIAMTGGILLPLFNYRYQIYAPPCVEGIELNTPGWFDFSRAWIPPPIDSPYSCSAEE